MKCVKNGYNSDVNVTPAVLNTVNTPIEGKQQVYSYIIMVIWVKGKPFITPS